MNEHQRQKFRFDRSNLSAVAASEAENFLETVVVISQYSKSYWTLGGYGERHRLCSNSNVERITMPRTFPNTMNTEAHPSPVIAPGLDRPTLAGFTLLEMMIVGAIVTVSVALALPSYQTWYARYQLSSAIREMTNDFTMARLAAMNRNRSVTVTVALASGFITIAATETSTGAAVFPSKTMSLPVASLAGTPAPTPSSAPVSVAFSPLGIRISPTGATTQQIAIANTRGLTYSIAVTPGGKTRWCPLSTCT